MTVSIAQLSKLKARIPEIVNNSQDRQLTQLLEDAEQAILDYTNRSDMLPAMEPLQRELALIYYNRIGLEGIASQSQGGISIQVADDIPKEIKSRLNRYRKVRFR